ncbi:MAG: hypothetical protein LBO62_08080, partial [Endomicrobium sp.]|nr:hypothetical protein [Endomicrobium sp.]
HNTKGGQKGAALVSSLTYSPLILALGALAGNHFILPLTIGLFAVSVAAAIALNLFVHVLIDNRYVKTIAKKEDEDKKKIVFGEKLAAFAENIERKFGVKKQEVISAFRYAETRHDKRWKRIDALKFYFAEPAREFVSNAAGKLKAGGSAAAVSAAKTAKDASNPVIAVETSQKAAIQIASSKERIDALTERELQLSKNLIVTGNMQEAYRLQKQGFRAAVAVDEKTGRGWQKIDAALLDESGAKTKVYWKIDPYSGVQYLFFKSKTMKIDLSKAMEQLSARLTDGMRDKAFKGIERIISVSGASREDALAKMRNIQRDTIGSKTKEAVLYLNGREVGNFKNFCFEKYKTDNIGVFVITREQSLKHKEAIIALRAKGVRFVIYERVSDSSENIEIFLDGVIIDADAIKDVAEAVKLLKKIKREKNKEKNGYNLRIAVKFSREVLSEFINGDFDGRDFARIIFVIDYLTYIVENQKVSGRIEIFFDAMPYGESVKNIIENDNVAAIGTSKEEAFQNNREIIEKTKSVKQRFERGEKAAWAGKFDDDAAELKLSEGSPYYDIIVVDAVNSLSLKGKIEAFKDADNKLSRHARDYLKHLCEKGEYEEAAGFIRGVVMKTVGMRITELYGKKGITLDLEKLCGNEKFYRAFLINSIQLMAAGNDIAEIINRENAFLQNEAVTAKDFFDKIAGEVDEGIEKILFDNEYAIKALPQENMSETLTMFGNFDVLVKDEFTIRTTIPKEITISFHAARSILSAA